LNNKSKEEIRKMIWNLLESRKVSKPPKPIFGRIPNFVGAERAALNLVKLEEFKNADVVFCNPDSPQRPVRENVLRFEKTLIMATPRLKKGFLILKPNYIPRGKIWKASTIKGAFKLGKFIEPWNVTVDLKVVGSVAVSKNGGRIGKGHGYSDLEYAILIECNCITPKTPIATTVHELQVLDWVPMTEHDMPVDIIVTPTKILKTKGKYRKPKGIDWNLINEEILREIPILKTLRTKTKT